MNRKKLTEAVFRALKPVKEEEEEIEDIEVTDVEDEVEIEEPTGAVVQSDSVARIQASLVDAIDAAQELGDEKLVTQIGNTITFLTRSQVRGAEAAVDEVKSSKYSRLAEKVVSRIRESKKKAKVAEDKDWIQKAIKRPGALHRELGVPKDKDIPKGMINKAISKLKKKDKDDKEKGTQLSAGDERELRQLNLAKTLSKFN